MLRHALRCHHGAESPSAAPVTAYPNGGLWCSPVHELTANAVRHGPGHGRLRISVTAGTLHCEVSDPGPAGREGHVPGGTGGQDSNAPGLVHWPVEHGHGLWVVREAADQFSAASGPYGSLMTAAFDLPVAAAPAPPARKPGVSGNGAGC